LSPTPDRNIKATYRRYVEWLDFVHRRQVVLRRIAARLGYEAPDLTTPSLVGPGSFS
jgi:hypothetical protein